MVGTLESTSLNSCNMPPHPVMLSKLHLFWKHAFSGGLRVSRLRCRGLRLMEKDGDEEIQMHNGWDAQLGSALLEAVSGGLRGSWTLARGSRP